MLMMSSDAAGDWQMSMLRKLCGRATGSCDAFRRSWLAAWEGHGQLSGLDPHCRYRFALRGLLPRIPRSAATGGMSRHDRTTSRMGVPGAAPKRMKISLVGERTPTLATFVLVTF